MKTATALFSALLAALALSPQALETAEETVRVEGLTEPVRILRDPWGVAHIYAANEADLFFAQGYNAARDRLFQLELWRRAATGTMAEIVGRRALESDIGSRLLRFRGDMGEELRHYHPRGQAIVEAFVRGVNAYVDRANRQPDLLPIEFQLLGIRPGPWTPEIVVSRHNGLFRNAGDEVALARLASKLGVERLKELVDFEPSSPSLAEAAELDLASIPERALDLYRASRSGFDFRREDIVKPEWRSPPEQDEESSARRAALEFMRLPVGSNNWVVAPQRSVTGKGFMANDPHRSLQVPSLRYFVHLSAPGWDVIGGGEPALPGISIGHNRHGAWGLTIFSVDQEDLYVYQTSPDNPSLYRYGEGWEAMREESERFRVEDGEAVTASLKFTRHGPVLFEDPEHHRAYALRAAWLETGSAPYLAALRFGEAKNWEEFRRACAFFLAPSENMVWADQSGDIGWQATGITPIRPDWSGLLPVAGDGRHEWRGYLPILDLPHRLNPEAGILATANENNLPAGYPHPVGYLWSPPFRHARLLEFLASRPRLSLSDMVELQTDTLSLAARGLTRLLVGLETADAGTAAAIGMLTEWDGRLTPESPAAALYALWERRLIEKTWELRLPEASEESEDVSKTLRKTMDWLTAPDAGFGADPIQGRDRLLLDALGEALSELKRRQGEDPTAWRYGSDRLHYALIEHPLSRAVNATLRGRLDAGPLPRGGNAYTVNMTTSGDNQRSGASFRVIADLDDWDRSLASNAPGQSGDPDNPHYRDLFSSWAKDRYFPLLYSRSKVEAVAESVLVLGPFEPE